MKYLNKLANRKYILFFSIVMIGNLVLAGMLLKTTYGKKLSSEIPENQPPIIAEVTTQQGDPIIARITSVDNSDRYIQRIKFELKNNSNKPVVGVTVIGKRILTYQFIENPLKPGDIYANEISISRKAIKPNEKVVFNIDYVAFEDGSKWGLDSQKESDRFKGNVFGVLAATEDIRNLVNRNDSSRLDRFLDQDVKKLDISAQDSTKSPKWRKGYRQGYKSVILILKRKDRKTEVLQQHLKRIEKNLAKQKEEVSNEV